MNIPKPYTLRKGYCSLVPFQPVLVRHGESGIWDADFFAYVTNYDNERIYSCVGGSYNRCITREGNEHLVGTADMPIPIPGLSFGIQVEGWNPTTEWGAEPADNSRIGWRPDWIVKYAGRFLSFDSKNCLYHIAVAVPTHDYDDGYVIVRTQNCRILGGI